MKQILSLIKMLSLPQKECEDYCREKRIERYQKYGGRVRFLRLHRIAHSILLFFLRISASGTGYKLNIIRDDRKQTSCPVIFCPTHIGGLDVEMSFLVIKGPCWMVMSDLREFYKNLSGMMLQMNGLIPFDIPYQEDRIAAKAQMRAVLEQGEDLLLFPEGAYNVSPNGLINHLFAGAVELAITCGAEIVPIVLERHEKTYHCIIGENLVYDGVSYDDRFAQTTVLRDCMATLKWEIIETLPQQKRDHLPDDSDQRFLNEIIESNHDYTYTLDDIIETQFHPKGVVSPEEAFSFLKKIQIKKNSAFLAKSILGYWNS